MNPQAPPTGSEYNMIFVSYEYIKHGPYVYLR